MEFILVFCEGFCWKSSKTTEFWAETLCLLEPNVADFWKSEKLYLGFPKDFAEKLEK